MDSKIEELSDEHQAWQALLNHLAAMNMIHWATDSGKPKPDRFYFAVICGTEVVGHLTIRKQAILVPASALTQNVDIPLTAADGEPLSEVFVETFAVNPDHRRCGYGRALQERALIKAELLGCCQMRSWSSADRVENYALKISMGFSVLPALYPMPGGSAISGVYFVKRIEQAK